MPNIRYNSNDPLLPHSVQESIEECNFIQAENTQMLDESGSEFRDLLEQFLDWYESFTNFTKRTVRKYMQIPGVPYVHNYSLVERHIR